MSVNLKSVVVYPGDFTEDIKAEPKYRFSSYDGSYFGSKESKTKLAAVVLRNATKGYQKGVPVLENLNMTIKIGTIYSLLGSSGCGKSTTLACITGLSKLTSGNVWVFGKTPGERESGVPGTNIGYMPQDYSLYDEFSIEETFTYFGMLNGMWDSGIATSLKFYSELLELPKSTRRVGSLSGGQKRRVSFAVSLMHNPELVILDEPTVGVDPLVRESIWKHLRELTRTKNITVIITTHYIDEARYSDTVGIMRNGQIIAEKSPSSLLEEYNTNSLEAVVLQLCRINELNINNSTLEASQVPPDVIIPPMASITKKRNNFTESISRTRALTQKHVFLLLRNYMLLTMILIFPSFCIFANFIAHGSDPSHVHFGIINQEINSSSSCENLISRWNSTCDLTYFSCKFISHINPKEFILKNYFSEEEAQLAVMQGDIWGYIRFPPEFSWEFYERAEIGLKLNPDNINKSDILVRMDQTSTIVHRQIEYALYQVFVKFIKGLLMDCNQNPKRGEYFLQYKEPILGTEHTDFRDFVVPGNFVSYMFFWPIIYAGIRYVEEKRGGTLERSLVAGITTWEIFLGYIIIETIVATLRAISTFVMAYFVFEFRVMGSLLLSFALGLLCSYAGLSAGLLFGSFCTEEIQVALLALATYLPNVLVSGLIWPLEGMPPWVKNIAYYLPCTQPCEAMRSMTKRGWEFSHPNVWPGFAASSAYILAFFTLAMIISTRKFIK